jgi:hypothetical protein
MYNKHNTSSNELLNSTITVNSKEISTIQCRSKTYFENEFLLFVRGQFNMLCQFTRMKNTVSDNEKINKMTEIRLFCHIS